MKVTSPHGSNLCSFVDFEFHFDDELTVLVGPHGSGKTNVVRVLDLVNKLVDRAEELSRSFLTVPTPTEQVLSPYVQAMHDGSPPGTPIMVRLGVEWTTESERERIVAFVRAAVLETLIEERQANDEKRRAQLSSWVMSEITQPKLASLFCEQTVLTLSQAEGTVLA